MVIKEEPTRLDEALRAARKETDRQILGMKYHLQMVTNKVVDIEKEAESKLTMSAFPPWLTKSSALLGNLN